MWILLNIDDYIKRINNNYDVDLDEVADLFCTLDFRLSKNIFEYNNIDTFVNGNSNKDIEPLYYSLENLIINLRSTVDILLGLICCIYSIKNENHEILIKDVLNNKRCTQAVRDYFKMYIFSNKYWNYIYMTRNQIIHETCIKSRLPIVCDEIYDEEGKKKIEFSFTNLNGVNEKILPVYRNCIELINDLVYSIIDIILNGYK